MSDTEPSPSTLKARRRKIPHFDDEPVQWHRNSTKHDKCPWCGLPEMDYFAKTRRACSSCYVSLDLTKMFKSGKAWFEAKLNGFQSNYGIGAPDGLELVLPVDGYEILTAWRASSNGRAKMNLKFGFDSMTVYWHREGHVPERDDGTRIMAAGSSFWDWIINERFTKCWEPDEPLNAMQVLARAATDDPVFAIMAR